jgi:hypothetical protein
MNAIKKQSNVDENIVLAYKTAKSREEADKAAIQAFRENAALYPQVLGVPDGKELIAEPERVATVLRFENKAAGTFDTFIYAYWADLCKTPAENAEIMSHSDWTETATFKLKESERDAADVENASVAEPSAEPAPVVEEAAAQPAPIEEEEIEELATIEEEAPAEPTPIEEEEPEEPAPIEEETPAEPAQIVEPLPVEAPVTVQSASTAPEPVAVAQPAPAVEPVAAEPAATTATKTAFDKLVEDLTDAGMSESLTKLSNAAKLRKIRGYGAYKDCTNPKASYIVAVNQDGHYVVLGPEKADGTRKNLSTGATGEHLNNYTPKLWFRR